MNADQRTSLEAALDERMRGGDWSGAATHAIRGFGPELLGFLAALLRDETIAADAFAQLCEDIWRGLPSFARRSSLRTWLYSLARHAAWRQLRRERRHDHVALDGDSNALVSRLAAEVRSLTLPHQRTTIKNRLVELREALPVEDQALLILRVDKQLDWAELAAVLHEGVLDDQARKRESARLRKRFQLVKEKLRERARAEGLLDERE